MHARVTLFEIDTLRIGLDDALQLFKQRVLPRLRQQPGCEGVIALETPEGKGMLISFWDTASAVSTSIETGFYDEQIAEFTMFLRQPPGREHYEVVFREINAAFEKAAGNSTVQP
jgi:heme-degrading monooxygenase HmoA